MAFSFGGSWGREMRGGRWCHKGCFENTRISFGINDADGGMSRYGDFPVTWPKHHVIFFVAHPRVDYFSPQRATRGDLGHGRDPYRLLRPTQHADSCARRSKLRVRRCAHGEIRPPRTRWFPRVLSSMSIAEVVFDVSMSHL